MAVPHDNYPPSQIISSAPLAWPNMEVSRHLYRDGSGLESKDGYDAHCIMVWDDPASGTVTCAGQDLALSVFRGAVVIIPAGAPVMATLSRPVQATKIVVDRAFVTRTGLEALGIDGAVLKPAATDQDHDLRGVAYLLTEAATGHQPLDDAMIAFIVREIAIHLVCNYSTMKRPRPDASGRLTSAKLAKILHYIATNLHKPIPVASLAREAGLSPAHFSRAFGRSTGRAPHAYVIGRRLAKAAHLLRNSAQSIDQIAAQCGFHDQAHLTRLFKTAMKTTPRAYRLGETPSRPEGTRPH